VLGKTPPVLRFNRVEHKPNISLLVDEGRKKSRSQGRIVRKECRYCGMKFVSAL
jgi:hypothetical protein